MVSVFHNFPSFNRKQTETKIQTFGESYSQCDLKKINKFFNNPTKKRKIKYKNSTIDKPKKHNEAAKNKPRFF